MRISDWSSDVCSSDLPRQVFDELRRASAGGRADYAGITYERIEAEGPIAWPCPTEDHPGTPRMFEDLRFYTDDGKAHFNAIDVETPAEQPDHEYTTRRAAQRSVGKDVEHPGRYRWSRINKQNKN